MCPGGVGRNGEIAFRTGNLATGADLGWRAVDPSGAEAPALGFGPALRDVVHSPDGEHAAWASGDTITIVKADGTEPRAIDLGDNRSRWEPAWSADGRQLAYRVNCAGTSFGCALGVLDVAAGTERQIGTTPGLRLTAPTWSPDGRRLVASGTSPDGCAGPGCEATDLFRIDADGTGLERVTTGGNGDADPAWSPDGERIAFSRLDSVDGETHARTDREIYTVAPDGTGVENLTDDPPCPPSGACAPDDEDAQPVWSPDGRRLAYLSNRGQPVDARYGVPVIRQVWAMRPDGSSPIQLTTSAVRKHEPTWRALPFLATQAAPECRSFGARATRDTAARIALDCTDANGDALELEVVDRPAQGTLGAITAGGVVTYTPPAGFTGQATFTYRAKDEHATSAPATVTVEVVDPPPPPPAPEPESAPSDRLGGGGMVIKGGGGSRGGRDDEGDDRPSGPPIRLPGDCTVDPRTGSCITPVGCSPLGDISGCVGQVSEAPGRRTARGAVATAAARRTAGLLRAAKVRIPRGESRPLRMALTPKGLKRLRRAGKVTVRVRIEVRSAGKVVDRQTREVTFKLRRRPGAAAKPRATS